ncbi:MAG: hypothetical protein WC378_05805 [Opitutaceae bacterium]|jgi:hypothetical protein
MKSIFLAGGFAGFSIASITGIIAGREPDLVLRDSAIACIACAFLFRWFWMVLVRALTEAVTAKRAAVAAAEAAAAQSKAK